MYTKDLFNIVREQDISKMKQLINAGADINIIDSDGDTPLIYAVQRESVDIVRLLIDAGADINATNRNGDTPLIYAIQFIKYTIQCKNNEVIRLLINAGAEVNERVLLNVAENEEILNLLKGEDKMIDNDFNFENEISIDLDNLHENWQTHSEVRYKYSVEVSHIDRVLKKIGEKIATLRARLIREYKGHNVKTTVQQIDAYCIEHGEHIILRQQQIDTEYNLNMAKNALKAFDDRKSALENEVKLWSSNYFATPKQKEKIEYTPKQIEKTEQLDNITKKIRRVINKKKMGE